MLTQKQIEYLERAIEIARTGMQENKGGPFGCVIVKNDEIIAEGCNMVTSDNDPTAHAEVVAIRNACKKSGTYVLTDCDLYASCEPCPMCLGAIYWARINKVIYANTRYDASAIEFDDDFIYKEIGIDINKRRIQFLHHPHPKAKEVFDEWVSGQNRLKY